MPCIQTLYTMLQNARHVRRRLSIIKSLSSDNPLVNLTIRVLYMISVAYVERAD
jgi:hypothetical protein